MTTEKLNSVPEEQVGVAEDATMVTPEESGAQEVCSGVENEEVATQQEVVSFEEEDAALDAEAPEFKLENDEMVEEEGEVSIFVVNRNWEDAIETELDVRGFDGYKYIGHTELYSEDLDAFNTFEMPFNVYPKENADTKSDNGKINFTAKKLSFNLIRLKKEK